ncbi:unnamed protein product [Calypogeia fissa]
MKGREVVALALVVVLLGSGGHFRHVECQVGPAPLTPQTTAALTPTFYATSCPNVNQIVRDSIGASMNSSQIVGPSVLRLFAHDCFVGGCDGSILLQDTSPTSHVERDASDNLSLQQLSFDAITSAKAAVEAQCPGVVSCADILVLASEDVVSMMGGPSWTTLLGRRDGLNSSEASVAGHLPGSDMNVSQLMDIFTSIGLSAQDLVTLSGAHTVGFAHCTEFVDRLYNFNNVTNATDPSLSASYLPTLQALCPKGNFSNTTVQALDPITAGVFDSDYFQQLQIGRGLLFSDQVLYVDNVTSNLVTTYANNQLQFFADFVTSMIAMSQVGVLTGAQGEVRLNCSMVNGANSVVPGNATLVPPPNSTIVPPPVPAPVPPANTTAPPPTNSTSNSTKPPVPPVIIPPPPVVIPSPPPPVVIPSPLPPVVIPSPPPPVVVIPSPPPPVVIPSPPPPVVIPSPPPPVVVPLPSPPPPVVVPLPSPPPPVVVPSPPPPVVVPSPPPPVVVPSPPPVVIASPPPPVARATPTLRPVNPSTPTGRVLDPSPGGRRRS